MPIKVMLIDSDIQNLQTTRRVLGSDYVILCSSKGHAALNLFKVFRPEALVVNRLTEGLDAEVFLNDIRKERAGIYIPVWMTRAEGAPPSLLLSRPSTVFLSGPASPVLIRVHLDWHFGLEKDRRPRIFET